VGHVKPDDTIEQVGVPGMVDRRTRLPLTAACTAWTGQAALRGVAEMENLAVHWRWRAKQLLESWAKRNFAVAQPEV
jgi:hypothetical protein